MCLSATEWFPSPTLHYSFRRNQRSKRSMVQIHRLSRRKRRSEGKVGKEMEEKNMKLYMENMCILKENEKLREKATLLHQENLALISQFQKQFSHSNSLSTTLHFSTPAQTLPSIKCSTTA